ncbi:Gfo/Idh/MocA family protein [Salinarimonas soli]|uniref:Gfo/Idh/MocA family oxidoreductase n=1 Tax=Salinarimonas soli TaxID=1638099 RepID=A0A5B2VDK6_9HYPH|nr:Gfo/Idh/MocA family oxidoreductase [Salinarimonas soli]KAA2236766.1 Gfo/Idh/MocA family oxidoreductase [Salinarimonas soli]
MSRIGMAVVGVGPAAQPHARSLVDLSDRIEVRHVVGRSPERLRAFADWFPFPVTTDLDAALSDPGVAAVIVLTPPGAHLDVALRCFAAGKHVLVEKPLELSAARGERLVAGARAAGRRLGVVLQHRFRPGARRLRALLAEEALGRVASAGVTVPWWRPQSYYDEPGRGTMARDGGGVLLTQAIHAIDLFRSLVGVSEVRAAEAATTLHRMETEDYAAALLRLGNGAPGFVMATTTAYPGEPERIEIVGTRGTARLAGGALEVSFHDGRTERVEAEGRTGAGAAIMDFPHDAHRDLIADFADAVAGGRDPLVSGEEALETQRLLERILARAGQP